jgi:hypothetical protein
MRNEEYELRSITPSLHLEPSRPRIVTRVQTNSPDRVILLIGSSTMSVTFGASGSRGGDRTGDVGAQLPAPVPGRCEHPLHPVVTARHQTAGGSVAFPKSRHEFDASRGRTGTFAMTAFPSKSTLRRSPSECRWRLRGGTSSTPNDSEPGAACFCRRAACAALSMRRPIIAPSDLHGSVRRGRSSRPGHGLTHHSVALGRYGEAAGSRNHD